MRVMSRVRTICQAAVSGTLHHLMRIVHALATSLLRGLLPASLHQRKSSEGIVKGGIRRLVYATPVDHAGHPIGYDVWDDLELWERALKKRQVWELFDPSRHSQPDFNLGVGNPARYGAKCRNEFHDKRKFFSHMAPHGFAFVPRTFLDVESLQAHLTATSQTNKDGDGRYFFKKALESRGTGVFPFYELSEIPNDDLMDQGVFQRPFSHTSDTHARRMTISHGVPCLKQAEVPRLRLWHNGAKFDLRVLAAASPGPQGTRVLVHRTFYARVAPTPFGSGGGVARDVHLTNLSQGGTVHVFDDAAHADGRVTERVFAAVGAVMRAMRAYLQEDRFQYFGFDFMLDKEQQPWLLEVNSTPHVWRCNNAGAGGDVERAMEELLCDVVEPELVRRLGAAYAGGMQPQPIQQPSRWHEIQLGD